MRYRPNTIVRFPGTKHASTNGIVSLHQLKAAAAAAAMQWGAVAEAEPAERRWFVLSGRLSVCLSLSATVIDTDMTIGLARARLVNTRTVRGAIIEAVRPTIGTGPANS